MCSWERNHNILTLENRSDRSLEIYGLDGAILTAAGLLRLADGQLVGRNLHILWVIPGLLFKPHTMVPCYLSES